MKEKHNGIISFWKFTFSLLIIMLHMGLLYPNQKYSFNGGSIAVDFFFIVSGYLFFKKYSNNNSNSNEIGKDTFDFFLSKIKRFLPYVLFMWIVSLPFTIFFMKYKFNDFVNIIYNILYIPTRDVKIYDIYGITWYIVCMIIVQTILYPILKKYNKNFVYIFSPIIVFCGLCYLFIKFGILSATWSKDVFCYGGIIRALIGINAGMFLCLLVDKIKKISFTDFSRFIMTIFEILGYVSIFFLANKFQAHFRFDCLMFMILFICIGISFSSKSLLYSFSNNKLFYFLEKISLPIYINQWLIIFIIEYIFNGYSIHMSYYMKLLIVICSSILIGTIELYIIKYIQKYKIQIKKIFINE